MTENIASEGDLLCQAIGRTVVNFQQLEQWLAQVLAMMLKMRSADDQYLVSASMSYGQKLDLFAALYPQRKPESFSDIDKDVLRKALSAAEEFRNRVVHSFWAVECDREKTRWIRIKGSLRGRKGFKLQTLAADTAMIVECNNALLKIRDWYIADTEEIEEAWNTLRKHLEAKQ